MEQESEQKVVWTRKQKLYWYLMYYDTIPWALACVVALFVGASAKIFAYSMGWV